jgi:hypothetical protein
MVDFVHRGVLIIIESTESINQDHEYARYNHLLLLAALRPAAGHCQALGHQRH